MSDTIAAIATGSVVSAIGIVRVSGPEALTVSDNAFRAASGVRVCDFEDRRMYYGEFTGQGDRFIVPCSPGTMNLSPCPAPCPANSP